MRYVRLVRPMSDGVGVFSVTFDAVTQLYIFEEVACIIGGRAFAIHRLGFSNRYHVRVGAAVECSCECLGFLRHGRCKHLQGMAALVGAGAV